MNLCHFCVTYAGRPGALNDSLLPMEIELSFCLHQDKQRKFTFQVFVTFIIRMDVFLLVIRSMFFLCRYCSSLTGFHNHHILVSKMTLLVFPPFPSSCELFPWDMQCKEMRVIHILNCYISHRARGLSMNTIVTTRNTCTHQPLAQGNDLRMQIFAFSPLFKKQ